MSKSNPLVGLISYGESEDSDDEVHTRPVIPQPLRPPEPSLALPDANAAFHPPPIPHCAWSACYDEGSGFTYYWNQHTNAVTWEAPQEYLMALKMAQHQLNASGSAEVSVEEWQLYQQTLLDKKPQGKSKTKPARPHEKPIKKNGDKRKTSSDDEEVKIELITSYHNSDSESNDEDTPIKAVAPVAKPIVSKNVHKKQKTRPSVEYGPSLPANQNYTIPIGPELPPGMEVDTETKSPVVLKEDKEKKMAKVDNDDSQDETELFKKLKDKAKLLEKLGGEIPSELQKMIQDDPKIASPKVVDESSQESRTDNIDDLLDEIEKKVLPKVKSKRIDIFGEELSSSGKSSPVGTPPREIKPLFPSSKAIEDPPPPPLPPSTIVENGVDKPELPEKKANVYLADSELKESRKKRRIDNSILPVKKSEVPSYTTKYSQFIEGFSSERTGLGFKEDNTDSPKSTGTVSYGNGLTFTKGEVLNEDKRDEDLDDMSELVEAKLKFLNEVQPSPVPPVQEMLIQWQTLVTAFRGGALAARYWRRWVAAADAALGARERCAAPPGWTCAFQRSEGRYRYRREADGLTQWEYPAAAHCDMEICTTPPPPEDVKPPTPLPPPLPPAPPAAAPPPPRPPPAPPAPPARAATPPPPAWHDPPPPGTDEPPEPKKEIGEELLSFYSDIAELDKTSVVASPEPPLPPLPPEPKEKEREKEKEKEKESKTVKKKSKVKISTSMGLKHKTVSNMVAKWQQVADEIHSD